MTDREKLVYLIKENAKAIVSSTENGVCVCLDVETLADHLLSHGVTVKEPQKPTCRGQLEDNGFFFLERKEEEEVYLVVLKEGWEVYFVDFVDFVDFVGTDSLVWYDKVDYGKTWRCWAEKPTEAERKNAKWEE